MKDPFMHGDKPPLDRAWTITTSCASGAMFGTAVTPGIGTLVGAVTGALIGNLVYAYHKKEEEKDISKEGQNG